MSNQGFNEGPYTYIAGEAIGTNLLVAHNGTPGQVALAGISGYCFAVSTSAVGLSGYGSFEPVRGRVLVTAGDDIAAGDMLITGESGVVLPEDTPTTRTANTIGQAETDAGAAETLWMVAPV